MFPNLERYKKDLGTLVKTGEDLLNAMQYACFPKEVEAQVKEVLGDKSASFLKDLPNFKEKYQAWYSESKALIRQLLPDRLDDFVRHYEIPKNRKEIKYGNYAIEDYLQGLVVTRGWEKETVVGADAAIPRFQQQLAILKTVQGRFESSLYDIRQLVHADLLDSELLAAQELLKHKFIRAAGAVGGVVLEKHLAEVCDKRGIKISRKNPAISDFNDSLKDAGTVDTAQWRFIQHLGDIRNLCDHNKKVEPTVEQVSDLLSGVAKIIKTVF